MNFGVERLEFFASLRLDDLGEQGFPNGRRVDATANQRGFEFGRLQAHQLDGSVGKGFDAAEEMKEKIKRRTRHDGNGLALEVSRILDTRGDASQNGRIVRGAVELSDD